MVIQRRLVEAVEITESQIHIVRLKGIFDASTVIEFEKVVNYLLARNFFKMVVDLGEVEFISSAGWGAFTAELRRVRESAGDIKLSGMNAEVFDVFLLLELDRFINSYDAEDEAITAFLPSVPAPAPVVELPMEVTPPPSPAVEETLTLPAEEKFETRLPAVFAARPPAIYEQPSFAEVEYQEMYTVDGETFEVESGVSAFDRHAENNFAYRETYIADDDTLEFGPKLPLAASGAEMYELLLTSGRRTLESDLGKRSLPPALQAPPDNLHEHAAADLTAERFYHDDLGASSERAFDEREPLVDESYPGEAQEFTDLLSRDDLHFSGHEPIIDAEHENNEFTEAITAPQADSSLQASESFYGHDTEAFSELSLDLERHLGQQERASEKPEVFAEFPGSEMENNFSTGETTQEFDRQTFAPEGEFSEYASEAYHENDHAEFSETGLSAPLDFSEPSPTFDNGNHDNEKHMEDFAAPNFSTGPPGFALNAYSAFNSENEPDDEFETQDIRDPWLLEEIDTLPEEYEMEEVTAENDTPIAAAEFMSDDFEIDLEPPRLAPQSDGETEATPARTEVELDSPHESTIAMPTAEIDNEVYDNADQMLAPQSESESDDSPMITADEFDPNHEDEQAAVLHETGIIDVDDEASAAVKFLENAKTNGKSRAVSEPLDEMELPKIPMSADIFEMIRGIIAAYPHYGPSMICKFLEDRVEPPVFLSRSTVYRYLCETNLNTREKRFEYAGVELDFVETGATDGA